MIKGLTKVGEKPSYIPPRDFSIALIDTLHKYGKESGASGEELSLATLKQGLSKVPDDTVRNSLGLLIIAAETVDNNLEKRFTAIKTNFAEWFDSMMDKATEWYKRNMQIIAIILGIGLAGAFNADAVFLIKTFWQETALRETVSQAAAKYVEEEAHPLDSTQFTVIKEKIDKLGLPLGWDIKNLPAANDFWGWFFKVVGIILTGLAISQGSSFWYDILKKVVNMRIGGPRTEEEQRKTA